MRVSVKRDVIVLLCFVIGVTLQHRVTRCPSDYVCKWTTDHCGVAVLHLRCRPQQSYPGGSDTDVSTRIDASNLPDNTRRLLIDCYTDNTKPPDRHTAIRLQPLFGNLSSVSHVTLKNIELIDDTILDFSGLGEKFSRLEVINVNLKSFRLRGITSLRSLILDTLVQLTHLGDELVFYNVKKITEFYMNNVGTSSLRLENWVPTLRQLMQKESSHMATVTLRKVQGIPMDLDLNEMFVAKRIYYLKSLDISLNRITNITGNLKFFFPSLTNFNFSNNQLHTNNRSIVFMSSVIQHDMLQTLDVSNTAVNSNIVNKHSLVLLSRCPLERVEIPTIMKFGVYYRSVNFHKSVFLETLMVKNKPICLMDRNSLSYFDLSKSRTSRPVQVALLMRNMEVLSLEDSNLVISNEQVFRNMGSLKTLLLGNNDIGSALQRYSRTLLRSNGNLRSVDLSSCELRRSFPAELLASLKYLEHLNISSNPLLTHIDDIDFSIHKELRFLNISDNGLRKLSPRTLAQFDQLKYLRIDLSNNKKLMCTHHLKKWIQNNSYVNDEFQKFMNIEYTYCILKNGGRGYFADLMLLKHSKNNWVSIASVTTSCFVIVVLLAALLVYLVKRRRAVNSYHTKQNSSGVAIIVIAKQSPANDDWRTTELRMGKQEFQKIPTIMGSTDGSNDYTYPVIMAEGDFVKSSRIMDTSDHDQAPDKTTPVKQICGVVTDEGKTYSDKLTHYLKRYIRSKSERDSSRSRENN